MIVIDSRNPTIYVPSSSALIFLVCEQTNIYHLNHSVVDSTRSDKNIPSENEGDLNPEGLSLLNGTAEPCVPCSQIS